jgi:lipid-binding SYLF domain-containing protein
MTGRNEMGQLIALTVMMSAGLASNALAQAQEAERLNNAALVLGEIMGAPDKAIPGSVLEKAEGIAVFPGTIKGGFVIAAQRGKGVISLRDRAKNTWSLPAFMTVTGGSIGAQIGGQAIDIVLVIMDRRGLENLLSNQFKVGADGSVAAGPVGRTAEASTDIQLRAQILSYSRSRGLFAGISLNGSSIRPDEDSNKAFYGEPLTIRNIVLENKAKVSSHADAVSAWEKALAQYAKGK